MENRIEQRLELKTPINKVWSAITNHNAFGEWFHVKINKPFAVNEDSTGHITETGYENIPWQAKIKTMDKEKLFAITWHPYAIDHKKDYSNETPTLVEFKLKPTAQGTEVTIAEKGFNDIPAERREEAYKKHVEGWKMQKQNLANYLAK